MFGRRQLFLACALALFFTHGTSGQESGARRGGVEKTAGLVLAPCEVPGAGEGVKEKARCGTYEVFENRAAKSGRKIKINVVVFPATGQTPAPDPLFYIPGGEDHDVNLNLAPAIRRAVLEDFVRAAARLLL